MGLVSKLITLNEEQKNELEEMAKNKCMSTNQLIRIIIDEYLKKEK